ncbi:MAG: endonuclease/exonuclease/phosphatase family protein [Akkermansiaceae bacterium]
MKSAATICYFGLFVFGLSACEDTKIKTGDRSSKNRPQGIHVSPETRLRIVCYNGYFTSVFPKDNGEVRDNRFLKGKGIDSKMRLRNFAKWAPKAHADIWAMQEIIYLKEDQADTSAAGIAKYLGEITGHKWHVAADNRGRLVLSRHPILWSGAIKNARGMAALIDLPESLGSDLLLINLHFLTKPPEVQVSQATRALDFIESVRRGEFPEIPKQTPIMICGDFNSQPTDRPYHILTKLNREAKPKDDLIVRYKDPKPKQLTSEARGTYGEVTWSGAVGQSIPQPPRRTIDYILLPKGFMQVHQSFLFNSLILPEKSLEKYGIERKSILLKREETREMVDHLPIFLDLK